RDDSVMFDLDARWSAQSSIVLYVTINALKDYSFNTPIVIRIDNILFAGTLRVQLMNPVNRWPAFSRIQASLLDSPPPLCTCDIHIAGMCLNHFPLFDHLFHKVLHNMLTDILYFPRHVVIDLSTKHERMLHRGASGILQVLVEQAQNLI